MAHEIKGQGIFAFVIITPEFEETDPGELVGALKQQVRQVIGPATPDKLPITPGLPKARSGKIMRRVVRKIASGGTDDLGDTSTLADPSIVDQLMEES